MPQPRGCPAAEEAAFLKLAGLPFIHRHVFDASAAPRGQLPYIVDDSEAIGDSDTIIAHLLGKHRLALDGELTAAQRNLVRHCSEIHAAIAWMAISGCSHWL